MKIHNQIIKFIKANSGYESNTLTNKKKMWRKFQNLYKTDRFCEMI